MTNIEQQQRKKMLNKIIRDIRMMMHGTVAPTAPRMAIGLMAGGFIGLLLGIYTQQILLFPLGCLVGVFAGHRSTKYKTWDESIYARLAEYSPLDQEAYRAIQALAAEDKLTSERVLEWATIELEKVSPRKDPSATLARQRFASK